MIFSTPYQNRSDAQLVALIAKGDKGAFQEILTRYQSRVYGFAFSLLRDTQEAEDISQEVFLRLYKTASTFRKSAALRTYLFRITRNLCIDFSRKMRPQTMQAPPEILETKTPLQELCSAELKKQIDIVLSGLPENQRAAIYLRHKQGMTYNEIAQTLGVTLYAVESLLSRARKTFRSKFIF